MTMTTRLEEEGSDVTGERGREREREGGRQRKREGSRVGERQRETKLASKGGDVL